VIVFLGCLLAPRNGRPTELSSLGGLSPADQNPPLSSDSFISTWHVCLQAEEFSRVYEQMKWLCTPAAMAGAQLQLPQAKAAQELSEPAAAPAEPVPATFNEFVVGAASTVDGYVLGRAEAAEAAEAEAGAEEAPVFGARPQAPALSEDGGCAARVPASELLSAAQSAAAGAAQVAPLGTPEFETPERITRADSGCIDSDVERSARQTEKATKVSRVRRPHASDWVFTGLKHPVLKQMSVTIALATVQRCRCVIAFVMLDSTDAGLRRKAAACLCSAAAVKAGKSATAL
jgi:hypothetical protein